MSALAIEAPAPISTPAAPQQQQTEGPHTVQAPRHPPTHPPHPPDVGTPSQRALHDRFADTLPPAAPPAAAAWDGINRRAPRPGRAVDDDGAGTGDCAAVCFDSMRAYLDEAQGNLIRHFDERFSNVETLIRSGFPQGDPAAHRAVHEGYIEQAAKRRRMWDNIVEKTVTGSVWVAIAWIAAALWSHFKNEVQK